MLSLGFATVHACGAYVLLMDLCERIEIIGDVRARNAKVHSIDLAVTPKNLKAFVAHVQKEFECLERDEMGISFVMRKQRVHLTILRKQDWANLNAFDREAA